MKNFISKYKHIWIFSYFLLYMPWFLALERKVISEYTSIHISLDDYIPFNEWFVIPYLLWFLYIAVTILFLFFHSKDEFYRAAAFLFIGMTICLIIYTIWPNGQNLRPNLEQLGRDNILIRIVSMIYNMDTSTNVCPSIHVFNSIGAHIAIHKSEKLRKYKWVQATSFILMILISLSTMFLKQHSAFDTICAIILGIIMYLIVYYPARRLSEKSEKQKIFAN
jgi:membrane-associated phospholipid phosphatase